MPMGSTRLRFSSCARKRQAAIKSVSDTSDVAILSMPIDSQSLFRRGASRLLPRRENKVLDDLFQGLLSEANQELASLLRDVRTESHGTLSGDARSQPVGELLMRAVRCAAKQSGYEISLSLGLARFDPSSRTSIGELMVKADQVMYEQKRRRSRLLFEVQTSTQSP